jgi:hypothetical protein
MHLNFTGSVKYNTLCPLYGHFRPSARQRGVGNFDGQQPGTIVVAGSKNDMTGSNPHQ